MEHRLPTELGDKLTLHTAGRLCVVAHQPQRHFEELNILSMNSEALILLNGAARVLNVYRQRAWTYNEIVLGKARDHSMTDPGNTPETLISVPNDLEAAMIVSKLAAHGVDATTSGEFTAGFRAEAPGEVRVLVRRSDLEQARNVLDRLSDAADEVRESHATNDFDSGGGTDVKRLLVLAVMIVLSIGILQSCL